MLIGRLVLKLVSRLFQPSGSSQCLPKQELDLPVQAAEVIVGPGTHSVEDLRIDA